MAELGSVCGRGFVGVLFSKWLAVRGGSDVEVDLGCCARCMSL